MDYLVRQIIGVKMDTKSEETKKWPNIRDVLNSEEEETPETEGARPEIHRMSQLRETNRVPHNPKGGSSVVTSDHSDRVNMQQAQATLQATPVTETRPVFMKDGCAYCDVILSIPLNMPDWSMVVGNIQHHHHLACGRKRKYSER